MMSLNKLNKEIYFDEDKKILCSDKLFEVLLKKIDLLPIEHQDTIKEILSNKKNQYKLLKNMAEERSGYKEKGYNTSLSYLLIQTLYKMLKNDNELNIDINSLSNFTRSVNILNFEKQLLKELEIRDKTPHVDCTYKEEYLNCGFFGKIANAYIKYNVGMKNVIYDKSIDNLIEDYTSEKGPCFGS